MVRKIPFYNKDREDSREIFDGTEKPYAHASVVTKAQMDDMIKNGFVHCCHSVPFNKTKPGQLLHNPQGDGRVPFDSRHIDFQLDD